MQGDMKENMVLGRNDNAYDRRVAFVEATCRRVSKKIVQLDGISSQSFADDLRAVHQSLFGIPPRLGSDPLFGAKAPKGDQWLHEIKFDGYWSQVHLNQGKKGPE